MIGFIIFVLYFCKTAVARAYPLKGIAWLLMGGKILQSKSFISAALKLSSPALPKALHCDYFMNSQLQQFLLNWSRVVTIIQGIKGFCCIYLCEWFVLHCIAVPPCSLGVDCHLLGTCNLLFLRRFVLFSYAFHKAIISAFSEQLYRMTGTNVIASWFIHAAWHLILFCTRLFWGKNNPRGFVCSEVT